MEVDKDHIHLLVQAEPRYFWKEHTFWSDGYFVSTIGNVSEQTLQKYINDQG
ncbi:MAG: transposase [Methanothrix sp.]|jgi:REP element-mobilizing transposase RayT|nr:transposase [Methanothrix sp.]